MLMKCVNVILSLIISKRYIILFYVGNGEWLLIQGTGSVLPSLGRINMSYVL